MTTSEPSGTQAAESPPSRLKHWWPLIALAIVVAALIVGERAFQRAKHRGWTTYPAPPRLFGLEGTSEIVSASDGALWFITRGRGVSRFDGETWDTYTTADGLVANKINSFAMAPDGTVWVGAGQGVSCFDGETWMTYTSADGLAEGGVTALAVAPDGTVWAGTWSSRHVRGAISHLEGQSWTVYTTDDGLAHERVQSIAVAADAMVWAGTGDAYDDEGGVSCFDGDTWTTYTKDDGLAANPVYFVAVAPDGAVWLGTGSGFRDAGISRFDGETWTSYTTADGLAGDTFQSFAVGQDGALWFGSWSGVSRFDPLAEGEAWTTYSTDDGLADNSVEAIAVAPDGVLWFDTEEGISSFDGQNWRTYTAKNSGLDRRGVGALAIDAQGRVWLASWDRLSVLDERLSLPAQTLNLWAQTWSVVRILGLAALAMPALVWTVRRVMEWPPGRQARLGGAVIGAAVGVVAAVPFDLCILFGLMGSGHGGSLEGTVLEPVAWMALPLCPVLGMLVGAVVGGRLVGKRLGRRAEQPSSSPEPLAELETESTAGVASDDRDPGW